MRTVTGKVLDREAKVGDVYLWSGGASPVERRGPVPAFHQVTRLGPKVVSMRRLNDGTYRAYGESYGRSWFEELLDRGVLCFEYNVQEHGAYGQRKGPVKTG